jgi:hypothetical protein
VIDLYVVLREVLVAHATDDAARVAKAIVRGRFRNLFWAGGVVLGHLLPLLLLWVPLDGLWPFAGLLVASGIYLVDHIWVRAPQLIPLS